MTKMPEYNPRLTCPDCGERIPAEDYGLHCSFDLCEVCEDVPATTEHNGCEVCQDCYDVIERAANEAKEDSK